MKIKLCKQGSCSVLVMTAIIWLLVFQNPLESYCDPCAYLDELTALMGAILGMYHIVIVQKFRPNREQLIIGMLLLIFVAVGLTGNVLYRYQPLKCVIIDLYTNLKFFFAIGTGYYLFARMGREALQKAVRRNAQVITLILFILFLVDRIFHFWPSEVRYGIFSAKLFYAHPTYLAGAMGFLLALLTVFYHKRNLPFIAMAVIILALTLRAKSMASAAVYVLIFVFFLVFHWKLKVWHVVTAGVGSIAIAWNKIRYYFIDLSGTSARSIMMQKSFLVMRDHFPVGSGFGTYGSAEAAKHYSSVYLKYGFNNYYDVRDVSNIENTLRLIQKSEYHLQKFKTDPETILYYGSYLMDAFWPTIFGQTGVLGTIAYISVLGLLAKRCMDVEKYDIYGYAGVMFALVYLIISSFAEPAFFNAVAVPLAVVMGMVFSHVDQMKQA